MSKILIVVGAVVAVLVLLVVALALSPEPVARLSTRMADLAADNEIEAPVRDDDLSVHSGMIYGRLTTQSGESLEGRLRWGGNEEAYWSDVFDGYKAENPWASYTAASADDSDRGFFGRVFGGDGETANLRRPFSARFGDVERIERIGDELTVTLKGGTVAALDYYGADDFGDGVRVWDTSRGVVDVPERQLRTIELKPTLTTSNASGRMYGRVRTTQGVFEGFVQWNRQARNGSDVLIGRTDDGPLELAFGSIRSIERHDRSSVRVTLLDGDEMILRGTQATGRGHRGVVVDDADLVRIRIPWSAFERVELEPGGTGPAYADFPPGRPLEGRVTTHDGRTVEGRLVYDLDEGETTETLDGPVGEINYSIPFGQIISFTIPTPEACASTPAAVTLANGRTLHLECGGDLAPEAAGTLIFGAGSRDPVYVVRSDVARIDLGRTVGLGSPDVP